MDHAGTLRTRDRFRYVLVGLAIALLVFPPLLSIGRRAVGSLLFAVPPASPWTPATVDLTELLWGLPLAVFGIAYLARPDRLRPAFWLLPIFFATQGVADVLTGLGGPTALPSQPQHALVPALPSFSLAVLLWVLRPQGDPSCSETTEGPDRASTPTA